jgi:hypothetical protein
MRSAQDRERPQHRDHLERLDGEEDRQMGRLKLEIGQREQEVAADQDREPGAQSLADQVIGIEAERCASRLHVDARVTNPPRNRGNRRVAG